MFIALGAAFVMGLVLTAYTGYIAHDYSSRRVFGVATLACVGFFVWLLVLNRRSRQDRA
jgi:hypothetical protein